MKCIYTISNKGIIIEKLIMFLGTSSMNNIELARYLQAIKYLKSIIIYKYILIALNRI